MHCCHSGERQRHEWQERQVACGRGVGVRPCMTDLPRIYMLYVHALCAGGRAYVRGITRHSDRVQPGSNMAIMFGLKTNLMDVFQAFEGTGVELTQKVLLKWE